MTGWQDDFLNMFYSVKAVVDKFLSTWTTNSVFADSYTLFISKIGPIEQNRDAQMANSKGVTTDKIVKREALAEKALFIVNRIRSYATVTANNELLESVHFTQSSFDKSRDTDIVGIIDMIIAKANANVTALATYGVTAALITDLQATLTAYSSYIAKPRTVTTQTKNATENLAVLFKEANDILTKRLDLDIEVFKTSKPDFYSQYQTARVVIATSGSATAVKGEITINGTGEPLKNVTLTFTPTTNGALKAAAAKNAAVLVKKTADKGKFRVPSLPEGGYEVIIKKIGFKEKVVTINVVNGESTDLNESLDKE
jgi:hypothetical protein